jgi:hypothetical protein
MRKNIYSGLFTVAMATLMLEILLTRIFSVTMYYHFAFLAISVAMFGMTAGALAVYLLPEFFPEEKAPERAALSALIFAVSIVVSFLLQLGLPAFFQKQSPDVLSASVIYLVIALPFFFSGICVCLALTKFPGHVGRLYAADLCGAALGCLLVILMLKIMDGPAAVIMVAALAGLGAFFFVAHRPEGLLRNAALTVTLALALFCSAAVFLGGDNPLLRITWVKGGYAGRPLYEKWNSFSRIAVWGELNAPYPRQLIINIDAGAATDINEFRGDISEIRYLQLDLVNLAHHLRPDSRVLVIGIGGGRDILSALAFRQKSVVGVEINDNIIQTLNRRFGDFSGHLDRDPKVTMVNDEARSYITRSRQEFDIIQASFIDTWAATSAGAMVLTENSLYTVEAWKTFFKHLSPRGIVTFSRWYHRAMPAETYRLTAIAAAALRQSGVGRPQDHIVVVVRPYGGKDAMDDTGTILVSKQPFSDEDLDRIEAVARAMRSIVVRSPRFSMDPVFALLAAGVDLNKKMPDFPLNLTPSTDDNPFFFNQLRLKDLLRNTLDSREPSNMKAIRVLRNLFLAVLVLCFLCIFVPLAFSYRRACLKGAGPLLLFFMSIGLGFMLVEIAQMQRLNIFLGHPVYGLSVVLFILLLFSGLGSFWTGRVSDQALKRALVTHPMALLAVLAAFGAGTNVFLDLFRASPNAVRILVAAAVLVPMGFFMGMMFPLGMRLANLRSNALTPWLWGVNGAASVCASVLAVIISMLWGISLTFFCGLLCYASACLVLFFIRSRVFAK